MIGGIGIAGIGAGIGLAGGVGNFAGMGALPATGATGAAATASTTVSISEAGHKALIADTGATAGGMAVTANFGSAPFGSTAINNGIGEGGVALSADFMGIDSGLSVKLELQGLEGDGQSQTISEANRLDKMIAALLLALLSQSIQQDGQPVPEVQPVQRNTLEVSLI